MNRQEYNINILELVSDIITEPDLIGTIEYLIGEYPNQRFGQIICNYICPDYRSENPSDSTRIIMNKLFNIDYDPFFEESGDTYNRLCQETKH